jgi:small subunit ribosomal protein S4
MGRYLGPRKKYLRRFGLIHGIEERKKIKRQTAFGRRLEEKQKLRFIYDLRESQFSRYVEESLKAHGDPAVMLYKKLEFRLDNAVYRLGFAVSRQAARQLVSHGHVSVNGRKVDIPSYHVEPRDEITLSREMLENSRIQESLLARKPADLPPWLTRKGGVGGIGRVPKKEEIRKDIDFNLIFEYYA